MKARVKMVCPVCDVDMTFMVIDRNEHPRNWVLSDKSRKHLEANSCVKPEVSEELVGASA